MELKKYHRYLRLLLTSWGGTPKVIVLKSTFWYDSMHGRTKKIPEKKIVVWLTLLKVIFLRETILNWFLETNKTIDWLFAKYIFQACSSQQITNHNWDWDWNRTETKPRPRFLTLSWDFQDFSWYQQFFTRLSILKKVSISVLTCLEC